MGMSIPNVTTGNFARIKGETSTIAPNGSKTSSQQFQVGRSAELNFKISNTFTNLQILDQNNKVVAQVTSNTDMADTSARLGPGTYTAVVTESIRNSKARSFSLDISEKKNVLLTAGGASLSGTALPAEGVDTGIQKHNINVLQGGTFTANFTLPNARWAMMDKDGKVVASSDSGEPASQDFLKKPTYKLEPGQYQMMIVPWSKMESPTPFQLSFVPRDPTLSAANTSQESAVSKTLREREVRLKQWAAEAKPTTTSV